MDLDRRLLLQLDTSLPTQRHYPLRGVELRAAEDGSVLTFEGYACITGIWYEMYGGPPYGWHELVEPGAFKKTLSERADVQFLINHGGEPLARTKSGTMDLDEDGQGEHVLARFDPTDPDVQRIAPKMRRGDMDEMSFAFRITRQRWEDEDGNEGDSSTAPRRRILEVNQHKGDVSLVNYGANDSTWGSMRQLDSALCELRDGHTLDPEAGRLLRTLLAGDTPTPAPTAPPAPPATRMVPVALLDAGPPSTYRRKTPAA